MRAGCLHVLGAPQTTENCNTCYGSLLKCMQPPTDQELAVGSPVVSTLGQLSYVPTDNGGTAQVFTNNVQDNSCEDR